MGNPRRPHRALTHTHPAQAKRRSSDLGEGGKKKAKTKHLTKEPSKAAEREASRRHQALEKEFSKAQRLRLSDGEAVPPASLASSPFEPPLVSTFQPPRAWSPQGETEQIDISPSLAVGPTTGGGGLQQSKPSWSINLTPLCNRPSTNSWNLPRCGGHHRPSHPLPPT